MFFGWRRRFRRRARYLSDWLKCAQGLRTQRNARMRSRICRRGIALQFRGREKRVDFTDADIVTRTVKCLLPLIEYG